MSARGKVDEIERFDATNEEGGPQAGASTRSIGIRGVTRRKVARAIKWGIIDATMMDVCGCKSSRAAARTRLTYLRLLIAECSRVSVRACVCLFIGHLESTDWKQSNNTRCLN